jgi:hypothetical protein
MMANSDKELERLKRLREQQLAARDPGKKQREVQRHVTAQYRARKKVTVGELWGDVSHKIRGIIIGLFLGLIAWILLAIFVDSNWVDVAGILAVVIFPIFGILIGSSLDWRDEMRDF